MGTEMGMVVGSVVLGCGERAAGASEPVIRYGNDMILTDIARQMTNDMAEINACLRDGHLNSAFLLAHQMGRRLESFQERLNDLRYGRAT